LVTQNDDVANNVRLLRSHGMTSLTWQRHSGHARNYEVIANGYNYRLDEIRAALGRIQLKKLGANNPLQINVPDRYLTLLSYWRGREKLSPVEATQILMDFAKSTNIGAATNMEE